MAKLFYILGYRRPAKNLIVNNYSINHKGAKIYKNFRYSQIFNDLQEEKDIIIDSIQFDEEQRIKLLIKLANINYKSACIFVTNSEIEEEKIRNIYSQIKKEGWNSTRLIKYR